MRDELITAWSRAITAELLWAGDHATRGAPVVPLNWPADRTPCAAVPLARLADVRTLPQHAAFTVHTEHPSSRTLVATGVIDVRWDLGGTEFVEHLLPQELAKHPPTKLRADSILARRENWWWVPRVLISLVDVHRVDSLAGRTRPEDALLVRRSRATNHAAAPDVAVVTADSWPVSREGDRVELRSRDGTSLSGAGEQAYVLAHRHSPDFERWESWHRSGAVHGDTLHLRSGSGTPQPTDALPGTAEPFGLLGRLLHHRRAAKDCKTGIRRAERQSER